ncbi:hypothetical protein GLX27_003589 [Malassezia furfur]|uniref:Uncharacterized protein n=1 Tax=Malassezia furfur TaxID=55194 RepID=A0ABY8ETJ2_MALFU|nr:hypothetical protein CBS14141_003218 [Malassezia furfur]WFD48916.1 hypothetical protein GLX27_003589 [Malassezia furfur]
MEVDAAASTSAWPLGLKRSRSILSDSSTTSDAGTDDRGTPNAKWMQMRTAEGNDRRKRRHCPSSASPSDEEVPNAPFGPAAWRSSMFDTPPRAPPASPEHHDAAMLDPMLDVDATMSAIPTNAFAHTHTPRTHTSYMPPTPSPLALSRLSMDDDTALAPGALAPHTGLGHPLVASQCPPVPSDASLRRVSAEASAPPLPAYRYSPGVRSCDPPGGRPLLRYTMGYREDCEMCRNRTPGHYNHVQR